MADFDINSIINSLSPEDIGNIKKMASSFMGGESFSDSGKTEKSQADLNGILNNLGLNSNENMEGLNLGMPDLSQIAGILPILKAFNAPDERINFINALKPMLSENKRQKADEAMKLVRLLSVLPLLKERGLM